MARLPTHEEREARAKAAYDEAKARYDEARIGMSDLAMLGAHDDRVMHDLSWGLVNAISQRESETTSMIRRIVEAVVWKRKEDADPRAVEFYERAIVENLAKLCEMYGVRDHVDCLKGEDDDEEEKDTKE